MTESNNKKDNNIGNDKDLTLQEHSPGKWFSNWEDNCIREAENSACGESIYSDEHSNLEQKLWLAFQNTASAIAQLYKDRAQCRDEMWISFQNAAEFATNLYKDSVEGSKSVSELALQCGYGKRNKELLAWAKKRRRHIRREELIGYLCGRSPPHHHRTFKPSPPSGFGRGPDASHRADNRMQTFRDAVTLNGLNGAMAGISFAGGDSPLRQASSRAQQQQDLPSFLAEEFKHRTRDTAPMTSRPRSSAPAPPRRSTSPSRKRTASPQQRHPAASDLQPLSPKRSRR